MKQSDHLSHLTPPPAYDEMPPPAVEQPAIEFSQVVVDREPDRQPLMEAHRQPDGLAADTHRDTEVERYTCGICGYECLRCPYFSQCTLSSCRDSNRCECESSCCCNIIFVFVIITVVIVLWLYFTSAMSARPQPQPPAV
jgi:hypothetical protein